MNQNRPPSPTDSPDVGEGRRRFLKRVVATTPILLTVAGRPAWANTCTLSGMQSGNLSRPGQVQCLGLSLGYWKEHPKAWPAGYDPGCPCTRRRRRRGQCTQNWDNGTRFVDVFGDAYYGDDTTLMQVLRLGGDADPSMCGAQAVAAVLNAACYGPESFGYTPGEIVDMYNARSGDPAGLGADLECLNRRDTCGP